MNMISMEIKLPASAKEYILDDTTDEEFEEEIQTVKRLEDWN